jgi:hypothetical protein
MLAPDGMANYYERIRAEASRSAQRASFFSAVKETWFGWFR